MPSMRSNHLALIIPALVAGIHVFLAGFKRQGGREKGREPGLPPRQGGLPRTGATRPALGGNGEPQPKCLQDPGDGRKLRIAIRR